MIIKHINTQPFMDQRPGTSGLRKKVSVFQQSHYLENFIQSIIDIIGGGKGKTWIIGGDGRYFNDEAIKIILRIVCANKFKKVWIGQNGLLSTPAVSHLIRHYYADGGVILSASHNPGGIKGDFGIKYNTSNGSPAPENIVEKIYQRTQEITTYRISDDFSLDLSFLNKHTYEETEIEIVDSVYEYALLMEKIFDFQAIQDLFIIKKFNFVFDAMHAATGPYALDIFEKRIGASSGTVKNFIPQKDFGGIHPDPNPIYARHLVDLMMQDQHPDFAAASDGDGDRNMVIAPSQIIIPSDSIAILAAHAHLIPAYQNGLKGVARSMPTSQALDQVAHFLNIPCYETPTGWKYFGNLLDAGLITLCGEESAGSGSNHIREKDGLWAILFWLNLIAIKREPVNKIVSDHWHKFGRHFYARYDYENLDKNIADKMMNGFAENMHKFINKTIHSRTIIKIDNFSYQDPIDGFIVYHQGFRLILDQGGRIVMRLSGTGTEGATLRIYLEQYIKNYRDYSIQSAYILHELDYISKEILKLTEYTGLRQPTIIT
ncbi:MAG: alpha-D-glucose phosphate-specific phosphoglucomutase [Alphaproteobacteria bacterium]|nr:alpha-D-glucose phosphate-specific phosphoglucomutase [Alphaproteobacteria bacterium]